MLRPMGVLDLAQVTELIQELQGWTLEGAAIRRTFAFADFPAALAFAVNVGVRAEAADHHPDITISYKKVTLTYSTHSEGGLTPKDFEGAKAADAAFGMADGRW